MGNSRSLFKTNKTCVGIRNIDREKSHAEEKLQNKKGTLQSRFVVKTKQWERIHHQLTIVRQWISAEGN